jgi:hypothetical protein
VRRTLGVLVLCGFLLAAGCVAPGSGGVDESDLAEDVDHDWNTTADATFDLGKDSYRAVYHLEGEASIELYSPRRIRSREPVSPRGLAFRYPNGTVVDLTTADVEVSDGATVITPPEPNGSIAFAADRPSKRLAVPTNVNGSYAVVLPEGGRVRYPLLGRVVPDADRRTVGDDGRVRLEWDDPERDTLAVEYYLERDLLILGGIVAVAAVALLGGGVYYAVVIRRLRRRRDEVALDLETGDSERR